MLKANPERLWDALMEMGRIGETPGGGARRLAMDALDGQARVLAKRWLAELGLVPTTDRLGNIFARREGTDPAADPVVIGSHLDTVPTGGKFDGAYGVIAALEVLRRLEEEGLTTRAPVELAIWNNEEGARFSPMTMGSSVFVGDVDLDFALSRTDPDGVSVAQALAALDEPGDKVAVGGRPFAAYLETHIEQGPLLKEAGKDIGIVTGSFRARYFVASVTGEAGHVGPTLMEQRHDALAAAAELILGIEAIGRARGRDGRSNAPHLELSPNVRGVIPNEVRLSCDIRHAEAGPLAEMEAELRALCGRVATERGVRVELEQYFAFGPIECHAAMNDMVRDCCEGLGLSTLDLLAVASHDAIPIMGYCPTALFFIPSETGISHNEAEWSTSEQCAAGADVLLAATLRAAG